MNAVLWVFVGIFGAMLLAFAIGLLKAYFWEIVFRIKKRKAIKENSPDKWIYKI